MSCGVCCGGGGEGSEAADGVGGPLSPPPVTAWAGNLAVVAMDTLPWLHLPAETHSVYINSCIVHDYRQMANGDAILRVKDGGWMGIGVRGLGSFQITGIVERSTGLPSLWQVYVLFQYWFIFLYTIEALGSRVYDEHSRSFTALNIPLTSFN